MARNWPSPQALIVYLAVAILVCVIAAVIWDELGREAVRGSPPFERFYDR